MNYFVEGLQGSGKSTLAEKLSERNKEYTLFREGDYSPAELAWCAYLSKERYEQLLEKYARLKNEIASQTVKEGDRYIVCYTRVRTETPGFYQDFENGEIYNGRIPREEFEAVILRRFGAWNGKDQIFECSLFQNIVENMILFYLASDEEIMEFYRKIRRSLNGRDYRIIYLASEDIRGNIEVIRKERVDENGNELWFPLMCGYFNHAPYSVREGLSDMDGLVRHLSHRQALEIRICREIFPENSSVWKSKNYSLPD